MQSNINSKRRINKLGSSSKSSPSKRGSGKLLVIGIVVMLLVMLNAVPWLLKYRTALFYHRRNAPAGGRQKGSSGEQQQKTKLGVEVKVSNPSNNDDRNDGDVVAAMPAGRGGDIEVKVGGSDDNPTTEAAEELLDSLTAQQLIDGGYTYRSYAEESEALATNNVAVAAAGAAGEASSNNRKKLSRSIASHEFATAKPYNALRQGRVCEVLPPNISLTALKAETARIGTYQEFWYTGDIDISPEEAMGDEAKAKEVMLMRTKRPTAAQLRSGRGGNGHDDDNGIDEEDEKEADADNRKENNANNGPPPLAASRGNEPVVKYAYVLMISNHKYVDGALVVAQSLRQHSKMVKSGEADLVLIISEKIKMSSVRLLTRVFTRVKIMYSMASFSPLSYYKTTFDKIYLFWLTEYKVVLFMDADSLVTGNPDGLILDKEFEGDADYAAEKRRKRLGGGKVKPPTPLTAVGGGDYFQTGLLIAKPDRQLFTDLYLEYRLGLFGYNQWKARDGVLIRTCFMQHHSNIEHPLDRLYHFYGFVKPWFNKDGNYKYGKGDEKLSFNPNYWDWWRRYEELHNRYFKTIDLVERAMEAKKSGSSSSTFAQYVYGNSANYPEKDVPIPGLYLKHPITPANFDKIEAKKVKGGWTKFDALVIDKNDFPKFYNADAITVKDAIMNGALAVAASNNNGRSPSDEERAARSALVKADPFLRNADAPQSVLEAVNSNDYMWIQRFSVGSEYFRPTYRKYAQLFNVSIEAAGRRFQVKEKLVVGGQDYFDKHPTVTSTVVVIGEPGASCRDACSAKRGSSGVVHGRCVEEALSATSVNDCFYGFESSFASTNATVVMPHDGHDCDVCTYEFKSPAAPFILPTSKAVIEEASSHGYGKKLSKKRRKKLREQQQSAKAGEEGRVHQQAVLEEDDEEAIRRRFELAEKDASAGRRLFECRVNFMHEKLLVPTCGATKEGASRVCVCV